MKLPIQDKKFRWLLLCVALAVTLEVLSLVGIELPMPYAPFAYAVLILGIGYEVLLNGMKALFKLKFSSINLLMLIAAISAYYLGEYSEAAVVIVLYTLGERLEEIGIGQSKSALNNLVEKTPKTAVIKESCLAIPIEKIKVGSIIQIKPHDMIPLDGEISFGETSIDESAITGEPIPKDKHVGDYVFAGTLNRSGFIEVKTTKRSSDSTFAKIVQLTFQATANKSDTQKFIQKFSKIYTPSIMALSFLVFAIPVFFMGGAVNEWLNQAITPL